MVLADELLQHSEIHPLGLDSMTLQQLQMTQTHIHHEVEGFTETSNGYDKGDPVADTAALTVEDSENAITYTVLGLRNTLAMDGFDLNTSLGWRHAFGDMDPDNLPQY